MLYVNLKSGDSKFVIDAESIETIITVAGLSSIKSNDPAVVGVLRRGGEARVTAVVDLNLLFGMPACPDALGTRILVTKCKLADRSTIVGVKAEGVISLSKNLKHANGVRAGRFLKDDSGEVYQLLQLNSLLKPSTIDFLFSEFANE